MRMMLNRRDNGEDGKTENTQGRPDSSYSLQELLIFPQPMQTQTIMYHKFPDPPFFCEAIVGGAMGRLGDVSPRFQKSAKILEEK